LSSSAQPQGLQAERTALAWTRTCFAVLANGGLLLVRDFHVHPGPLKLFAAALALAIALFTYLVGIRRQRTLGRRPLPRRIAPRAQVHLMAVSVIVLALVSALALAM
jgi:uncharacterized membrane protein YidH (DUF202 family)